MKRTIRIAGVALVAVILTWIAGWWSVPILGAVYAIVRSSSAAPMEAGIGVLIGWGVLSLINAGKPGFTVLLDRLGGIFPVPGAAVLLTGVLFASLLAWSSARVVQGIRSYVTR